MSSSETDISESQAKSHSAEPTIYPPITHSLSPTWFTWVKLTAYEIHNVLTPAPANFASSLLYNSSGNYIYGQQPQPPALFHYINHPIQYVSVAGVVVEVNEFNPKYHILILDDSSGEIIEIVYPKPIQSESAAGSLHNGNMPVLPNASSAVTGAKVDEEEIKIHQLLSTMDVGTVLKVKGHISTFRDLRQIRLDRVHSISDTNEEASFWSSMRGFHDTVLSKPWVLTDENIAKAKADARKKAQKQDTQAARRRDRMSVRAEIEERGRLKLERRWEKEERRRAIEAEKARMDGEEAMKFTRDRKRDGRGKAKATSTDIENHEDDTRLDIAPTVSKVISRGHRTPTRKVIETGGNIVE